MTQQSVAQLATENSKIAARVTQWSLARAIAAGSLRCLRAASEKKTKTKTDCNFR